MSGRPVRVEEIGIDAEGRVYVRPVANDYEHIYRAAMEIYWDRDPGRLSHPQPRNLTPAQWLRQIIAAVADEYGDYLVIDARTIWTGITSEQKSEMEGAASQS